MCSANKVAFVDAMHGANLYTFAAACAERIVDDCQIVRDLNSTVRASLLTLHAANASIETIFTGLCTLIVVRTLNHYAGCIVDQTNDGVGTRACADATTDALARVNVCNAALNGNCIFGAHCHTVAVTQASVGAKLIAAIRQVCRVAGFLTLVIILSFIFS